MNIWMKTQPEKSGWYWFSDGIVKGVVRVSKHRAFGQRYCAKTHKGWQPVGELDAEWCGPLVEPKHGCAKCGCRVHPSCTHCGECLCEEESE